MRTRSLAGRVLALLGGLCAVLLFACLLLGNVQSAAAHSVTPADPDINGWDKGTVEVDQYGADIVYYGMEEQLSESPEGFSKFRTKASGSILNVNTVDVTKPLKIQFTSAAGVALQASNWLMFGLIADWQDALEAGVNFYQPNMNSQLVFGIHNTDYYSPNAENLRSAGYVGCTLNWEEINKQSNKLGASIEEGYYETWEIFIGENSADGYIKLNGAPVGTVSVSQAAFGENKTAYLTLGTFHSTVMDIKMSQEFDVTLQSGEHGTASFRDQSGDALTLESNTELILDCRPEEGYMVDAVKVNGELVRRDADGEYRIYTPFADAEVEVTFTELKNIIEYYSDGELVHTDRVDPGTVLSSPADPQKEGYDFLGWYRGDELFDFSAAIQEDVTLTAKWEIKHFTVTFKGEGIETFTQSVDWGGKATLPEAPVREGYTFVGWNIGGTVYDFSWKVDDNVTLTAVWKAVEETGGCGSALAGGLAPVGAVAVLAAAAAVILIKRRTNR